MAGRSYLQRIAEPLRRGDPVLFAIPSATPDEARPFATARAAPITTASSAPVVRRKPLAVAPPVASAPAPAALASSSAPLSAADASVIEEQVATPPVSVSRAQAIPLDMDHAPEHPAPPLVPPTAEPADRVPFEQVASSPIAAADIETGYSQQETIPGSHPASQEVAPAVAPGATQQTSPMTMTTSTEPPLSDAPSSPQYSPRATAAPPRIYIGTVEVHAVAPSPPTTPDPAPVAAPSVPSAPISRGYGWRFGLVQG